MCVLSNLATKETLGLPEMLGDCLLSQQTKLEVLSQKELTLLQNNYR